METALPLPASAMERSATALSTARLTSARAAKEPMAVAQALIARIEAAVDEVGHGRFPLSRLSRLVDPHVPLDQPANLSLGSRATSSGRESRRAAYRFWESCLAPKLMIGK